MDIIQNKALVVKTANPKQILQVIQKSEQISDDEVIVCWGLQESQVLNALGFDPPSPVRTQYEFPGMYRPFQHQIKTTEFLTLHKKCFIFSEQGTGKTASVIWAADYLMSIGLLRRVLIVCPLSIMKAVWQTELFKIAMHRSVEIAYGAPDKRRKIIKGNAEFIIVNYEGVEIVEKELAEDGTFDLVIIDECNNYKTVQTKRWKTMARVLVREPWTWLLTGTPAAQSPCDAFGLARIVNPAGVPRYYGAWRDLVMNRVTQFKYVPKTTATQTVYTALQPAIRFTKEECLDLPPITYVQRDVELTKQQLRYYELMRKHMLAIAAGEEITAVNAATNLNKLLQISCGAVYTDSRSVIEFDTSNRYEALKEIIDEASEKVLIFVPFVHTIEILRSKLNSDGYSADMIYGAVSSPKRNEIFSAFRREANPRILILQPDTAALGLNLTQAATVVWWSPTTKVDSYLQANDRIHRIGQTHACTVFQLQGSGVEMKLNKALREKITHQIELVSLYKNVIGEEDARY